MSSHLDLFLLLRSGSMSLGRTAPGRWLKEPHQRYTRYTHSLCRRPLVTTRPLTTSAHVTAEAAAQQLLERFSNKTFSRRQVVDGNQVQRLSLTLNRRELWPGLDVLENPPPSGTILPPGYHLVYFTPAAPESELGHDGSDRTFNAPAPFTRRMWAGGRMEWRNLKAMGMRVGDEVEERTSLEKAEVKKSGRDGGEMVLVEVVKEFLVEGQLALVDRRSWIFRPDLPVMLNKQPSLSGIKEDEDTGPDSHRPLDISDWESTFTAGSEASKTVPPARCICYSPTTLFRFSALTFNAHKIHYNESWTRGVEGHPKLVVHGPLNLINLLDYYRDSTGRQIDSVEYRASRPVYVGDTVVIKENAEATDRNGGGLEEILIMKESDGGKLGEICMRATVRRRD